MKIEDRRADKAKPWGYVVALDTFLSNKGGWKRSLYALAVRDHREAEIVLENAMARTEMRQARIQSNLPRLRPGDHLAVVDRHEAGRWYEPGAFRE